ncbi:S49 family peptidase [Kaarinaea lacus]
MTDQDKPGNPDNAEENSTGSFSGNTEGNIRHSDDVWTQGPEIKQQGREGNPAKRIASGGGSSGGGNDDSGNDKGDWERDVLNRLAFASINEQRRARRWSIFFKSLLFIYLFAILFYIPSEFDSSGISPGEHIALIDLEGVIAPNTPANADSLVGGLREAFKNKHSAAVILRINSPGGSPVQSGYVYDEIKRLREKYPDKKLYAVVADICASGGYYIASAADEIYADKASIVGSIGVLMDGFGFVDALDKLGIERRLMTAGKHKGVLDPFSPLKKDEVDHVQGLLDSIHQQFINKVKEGRGDRLSDSPDIFSGLFWNGEEGMKLGLVDGLGSSSYVAREIIGVEKIVDYTPRQNYLDRFADRFGAAMANVLATTMGIGQAGGLR